jgi:hypothetical protein
MTGSNRCLLDLCKRQMTDRFGHEGVRDECRVSGLVGGVRIRCSKAVLPKYRRKTPMRRFCSKALSAQKHRKWRFSQ